LYTGEKTLPALVAARAAEEPDRPLVRFEDDVLTGGQLHENAMRVAQALTALGLGPGDKAALMLDNGREAIEAWFGMTYAGIVEVPINTAFKGDLLTYMLTQAECKAIVTTPAFVERIEVDIQILVVGGSYEEALAAAPAEPTGHVAGPHDPSVILFTSGTTGPSKGVVLSHNANLRLCRNVCEIMAYERDEVLFTAFPLFHVNAKHTTVLPALYVGGEVVMRPRFSASRFWDICREEGVTAFNFMGALLMMLHKQPPKPSDREHKVAKAYGAPAPVTIFDAFQDRFGVRLVEVYGSTELGTATGNTVHDSKVGSCGVPAPHYEVEIHDEDDNLVPPGTEGEICVRPKEPDVMVQEYYRMPEATLKAFRNLWFHTGDRGRMDADGRFYFVDRMKDAIRRRGENISSWEVEKSIDAHEAVQEAAVIGVPSELTEEEVLAFVVLKPDHALTPEQLLDHCQARMAHFAVPRYVRFVNELPKNPAQRIEKYRLREGALDGAWDRERHGYEVRR
jgi:crotonobetaine/carnitine-CoA ligase